MITVGADVQALTRLDAGAVTFTPLAMGGLTVHASLGAEITPWTQMLASGVKVDFSGYHQVEATAADSSSSGAYLAPAATTRSATSAQPAREREATWRAWPWPSGLDPFVVMAHSTSDDRITLLVDGVPWPVTDEALGALLDRQLGLDVAERTLEDPLVVLTCTSTATRRQTLADQVGRLVWLPVGLTTLAIDHADPRDRSAGNRVILSVRAGGPGRGGWFVSAYPQGPAGDRVRWAYRGRFAAQALDWLLEHRADIGARVPSYAPPLPFGHRRTRGLSYFDRRERASRAGALNSSDVGATYVTWAPDPAYRPGRSAESNWATDASGASEPNEPWEVREEGTLPFDPDDVVFVATYYAEGRFAVYAEWRDTSYWETPQGFGARLRRDLAAVFAGLPSPAGTPSPVVLLSDFGAVPPDVRAQVAQAMNGPDLITVNAPSTLFRDHTDRDPAPATPLTRIAVLTPALSTSTPEWTSTTSEGVSTSLTGPIRPVGPTHARASGPGVRQLDAPRPGRTSSEHTEDLIGFAPNPLLLTDYRLTMAGPAAPPFTSYPPVSLSQAEDFPLFTATQKQQFDVNPTIKVSADRTLAINGSAPFLSSEVTTAAQEFYATEEVFETAQTALRSIASGVSLTRDTATTIQVDGPDGPVMLTKITPVFDERPSDECQVIAGQVMGGYPGSVVFDNRAGIIWSAPVHSDGSDLSGMHHLASWLTTEEDLGSDPRAVALRRAADAVGNDTGTGLAADAPLVGPTYGSALNPAGGSRLRQGLADRAKWIGVNEFARPRIGQAYVNQAIFGADTHGRPDRNRNHSRANNDIGGFGHHFAAVVAESQDGSVQITLENHARKRFNDRVAEEALKRNLQAHGNDLDEIEAALTRSDDAPAVKIAKTKLIAELRALKDVTDSSGRPLDNADPRYTEIMRRARTTIKQLSDLPPPGATWHFKMYSRRPGETFHEQQTIFYDESVPAERNNPLTAVTDVTYELAVPPVLFERKQRQMSAELRETLRYTLVRPLVKLSRRREVMGLPAPTVRIVGSGNGDLIGIRPGAGSIRADDVRRQIEQILTDQARQSGTEPPPMTISTATGPSDWARSRLDQNYRQEQRRVTIDVILPPGSVDPTAEGRSTPLP